MRQNRLLNPQKNETNNNGAFMILWISIILASVLLDQATKIWAIECLGLYERIEAIPFFINFYHIKNPGAAWGMFSDSRWVFLVISSAAIIGLPFLLYKYRNVHGMFGWSLSLIIGGAAGNMVDRLFAPNGYVTDFIEFAFMDFPIFNVADICVCIGAFVLFIYLAFFDKVIFPPDEKKKNKAAPKSEGAGEAEND
jgi:signal peptidase II